MVRTLKNYWRNAKKHRATSIINITGLAIGMASAVMIFLWVQNELNYDNYHAGNDRIHRIKNYLTVSNGQTWIWEHSPLPLAQEIRKQIPEVEEATRIYPFAWAPMHLKVRNELFAEPGCAYVDERWFNVFRYKFVAGSAQAFNQQPFNLVITESKARKFFGSQAAIGKTIRIDTVNYTVQGVIKDNPLNSSFQFDVLIPVAAKLSNPKESENERSWGNFNYLTFVRLSSTAKPKTVAGKIQHIFDGQRDRNNLKVGLIPLSMLHFENNLQSSVIDHGNRNTVYIFTVLGILILLIACINYVNLTTARASLRLKEVSIKKIVGADRLQLVFQFIGESALMSLASLLISLGLIAVLLPVFNNLTGKEFEMNFTSPLLWTILGGALLTTILLTSIYPAVLLSSFQPVQIFRGRGFLQVKDSLLRKGLVVVQFTFSIALIIGVLVVTRQLNYIQQQDNGYNRSQVLSYSVSWKLLSKFDKDKRESLMQSMKQALLAQSGIEQVSVMEQSSVVNMTGLSSGGADWEGRDPEFNPSIAYMPVDVDFNKIVSLDMVDGKWFGPGKDQDRRNVIMNETAVKELGIHQPVIGQRFKAQGDSGIIIGVVKDFHYRSMHDKIGSLVIKKTGAYGSSFLVKTSPGQVSAGAKIIETVWKQFFAAEPLTYNFLDEEFNKLYKTDQKTSLLVSLFAAITIIISCLGLFGLAAFTAERRTKEIGIRKVLGAGVPGIVQLLSKEFVLLVLISFILASPVAWWAMNTWLQDFAYRIDISWWLFVIAGFVSIAIALITVGFQAIRAALLNPVTALRSE